MTGDDNGYNPRFERTTFANGDKCTAHYIEDGGTRYWIAVDSKGNEYETPEMPVLHIDITNAEHWTVIID